MKILIFNWRDLKNPEGGGAEVFTHENAKRWVKKGHEVTLFSSLFEGGKKREIIDGVNIIRDGNKLTVYKKAKQQYKNVFSRENFNIVIDEINTRPFFTRRFVKRGETIVALIHQLAQEFWYYETPLPVAFIGSHFLEKYWLRNYRDIPTITVSNSTKEDLMKLGFQDISVVSEGISFAPLSQMPVKEENPTIIFVGRLKKAKRPDHLVKAFDSIVHQIPRAQLWIVGDGYLRKDLENIASERVTFFGYVSEQEKIDLLSRAWVLVNPSVREGWGINIIEANACGTPCIAYDIHGLRDSIVDGKTGRLVKELADIDALALTILDFLKNVKLREQFSNNALEWSKKFNWDRGAMEFLNALERFTY
jgi:glycosyltransferase involved in cell wall biosynthesis